MTIRSHFLPPAPIPKSSVPGILWPATPAPLGASMLAMQFQLQQSQWWAPEVLREQQFRQLALVLSHACETVPFYRERFRAAGFDPHKAVDEKAFSTLPLLARSDVHRAPEALVSTLPPPAHGRLNEYRTSGSTGMPIRGHGTELTAFFWNVFALREHLWHRREPGLKLAAIRPDRNAPADAGHKLADWGAPVVLVYATGPSSILHSRTPIDRQVEWLREENPDYLITLPSNLRALAEEFRARGLRLPKLRQLRTYGENLGPDVRAACAAAFGVSVVDVYSAQEVGYIALQCPEQEHYHVQSEGVLVETLRDDGRPCAPGEVGKVVITTLHNFAFPLIRYVIADYAEAGAPCPCGRGLPVIRRILGRERNLCTTPDGRRFYPTFAASVWSHVAPIRQIQMIQRTRERIEVRLAMPRPLEAAERIELTRALRETLGHPFELVFTIVDEIPRGPGGKYEDFISEVAP